MDDLGPDRGPGALVCRRHPAHSDTANVSANVANAHLLYEGHDYGYTKRLPMYRWMARHLKLDLAAVELPGGGVDESDTVADDAKTLRVWSDAHPRPKDAPVGTEAVQKVLEQQKAKAKQ